MLGGARSGKSAFAQALGESGTNILFVATAEAHDDDMRERIARHQRERRATWATLEEPVEVGEAIRRGASGYDTLVMDCLTLWVSNVLLRHEDDPELESRLLTRARDLLDAYDAGVARWIVVSNEVGLGVVPPTALGRSYRDLLGRVNQLFAQHADKVYYMVAGLPLDVKALAGTIPGGAADARESPP